MDPASSLNQPLEKMANPNAVDTNPLKYINCVKFYTSTLWLCFTDFTGIIGWLITNLPSHEKMIPQILKKIQIWLISKCHWYKRCNKKDILLI